MTDEQILDHFEERAMALRDAAGTPNLDGVRVIEGVRALLSASKPAAPMGWKLVPDHADVDAIVTSLYRRFKDWSKRGFGPDEVTWCEVKADVLAMLAASPAAPPQSHLTSSAAESNDRQIDAAGQQEPVAWRVEQRAGRYTFVEHVENLKLYAGANIVPLFRAFHSVDANLNAAMDRLESMVTWEPRLLSGADATSRLENINRLLYELLNPHPNDGPLPTQPAEGGETARRERSALERIVELHAIHASEGNPITLIEYDMAKVAVSALAESSAVVLDERAAFTNQQIYDEFSFLEGAVNESTYRRIADKAIEIARAASPQHVSVDDERAAFEAAWSRVYDTGDFLLRHHTLTEQYANHDTQRAWEGWKLARAAFPQPAQTERALTGWQPIETAPEGQLLVVMWIDKEEPENSFRCDFDYLEDGIWSRHADEYDHFCCVAPPESRGPNEKAPYTHWILLPAAPIAARPDGAQET